MASSICCRFFREFHRLVISTLNQRIGIRTPLTLQMLKTTSLCLSFYNFCLLLEKLHNRIIIFVNWLFSVHLHWDHKLSSLEFQFCVTTANLCLSNVTLTHHRNQLLWFITDMNRDGHSMPNHWGHCWCSAEISTWSCNK